MLITGHKAVRRAKRRDRIARWVIALGGLATLASVIAIVVLIVGVTLPLFRGARADIVAAHRLPASLRGEDLLALGVDLVEMREQAGGDSLCVYALSRDGTFVFLEADGNGDDSRSADERAQWKVAERIRVTPPGEASGAKILSVERFATSRFSLLWSDGSVSLVEVKVDPQFDERGRRRVRYGVDTLSSFAPEEGPLPLDAVVRTSDEGSSTCVRLLPEGKLSVLREAVTENLLGMQEKTTNRLSIDEGVPQGIHEMTLDAEGNTLYAGTDDGLLARWQFSEDGQSFQYEPCPAFRDRRAITSLSMVFGDVSLAVGDARGGLSTWAEIRTGGEGSSPPTALPPDRAAPNGPSQRLPPDGATLNSSSKRLPPDGATLTSSSQKLAPDGATLTSSSQKLPPDGATLNSSSERLPPDGATLTSSSKRLRRIHQLTSHQGRVLDVLPSQRDMSLLSLDERGTVHLDYVTSEGHLLTLSADRPLTMISYSPRGNAMVGLDRRDNLLVWKIDDPHPEITWGTLFGKVHYDNHDEPKYMWQSSGTHEPKFSLVPVIFGTFKSTAYAMLLAVPLALAGAIYVSRFTTPGFRRAIKPAVEIMAAVPTVVVGFLVLLWLAPKFGDWMVALAASLVTIPFTFVVFMLLWQGLRRYDWAKRVENGYEFIVLGVVVIVPGVGLAFLADGPLEAALFDGDFKQWMAQAIESPYEQLNSLVVAIGLGFAVIPIIFSIAEDALSEVPRDLSAASLALGASRWQTAWRVVLPSASPAIFAAVMIGFGRAVGETMIVFMATGNTPILDWSPFNGFRTLSANIAVEISEAPRDGTLYRVLFLCAVLLFLLTFVLNTAAELVRQHLRKKYGRY